MYVPISSAKFIHLIWEAFSNLHPKLKNPHKVVILFIGLVGNKCMILNKEYIIKNLSIQNKIQLAIFESLYNMGYMNKTHNIMFWINIFITVEPTPQYPHIDNSH